MKQSSSEPATSAIPAKKLSTSNITEGFSADSIPPHHYHLGENNYVIVSDFEDVINVHIRKFRTYENGRIFPSEKGVSFTAFMWETLSNYMSRLPLPLDLEEIVIIRNTLFLATAWIENVSYVSLQRFITRKDFSRKFLSSHSLISGREWNRLQCIREKITESCKSLMFGNLLKKRIQLEILARSPCSNLDMGVKDINMILTTSLTEILSMLLMDRIENLLVCQGCIENQANQLSHECVTMSYETRCKLYGDLALFSIDIGLLVKDFIEKNIQMVNYINETFLNNLNMDFLVKNSYDMYIASDCVPCRRL